MNRSPNRNILSIIVISSVIVLCVIYAYWSMQKKESFLSLPSFIPNVDFTHSTLVDTMRVNSKFDDPDIVPVFWTGGIASTFRICYHLFVERRRVRPIYIAVSDADDRESIYLELETMIKIREKMEKQFPQWKEMLLDTHSIGIGDPDSNTVKTLKSLLGDNTPKLYSMLANVSEAMNPKRPVELVIPFQSPLQKFRTHVHQYCKRYQKCEYPGNSSRNHLFKKLFGKIVFILLDECYTKEKIKEVAEKHNFEDILKLTWSCWYPKRASEEERLATVPCGKCTQCYQRKKYGF
jgi:hypothetical protein